MVDHGFVGCDHGGLGGGLDGGLGGYLGGDPRGGDPRDDDPRGGDPQDDDLRRGDHLSKVRVSEAWLIQTLAG